MDHPSQYAVCMYYYFKCYCEWSEWTSIVFKPSCPSFRSRRALFTNWSTQDRQVFDIPHVSPDIMKIIIEFAYTAFPAVTQENVQESFIAAHQFNVTGITQACCSLLEEHLAPGNCIGIWRLTGVYHTPELTNKAFLYTLTHFEEVASVSEEFPLLSVQELVQIIEDDHLNVKQEKTVFVAILSWIAYAAEERREHISLLLSNVSDR